VLFATYTQYTTVLSIMYTCKLGITESHPWGEGGGDYGDNLALYHR